MARQRIQLTESENQFIRDNWGKMARDKIARTLRRDHGWLSSYGRDVLKLPDVVAPKHSFVWTQKDDDKLMALIEDGKKIYRIAREEFPHMTYNSVVHRVAVLRRERMAPSQIFQPKPTNLEPLQYTREDRPVVTLDYACQWMAQAMKANGRRWERPEDDKEAWRQINVYRLHGPIPVPPFLPDRRPVHNDNERIAPLELPAMGVGA